jgi:hypothetical protein
MGEIRHAYKALSGKLEGKSPLAIRKSRWEDNIAMNHREIG